MPNRCTETVNRSAVGHAGIVLTEARFHMELQGQVAIVTGAGRGIGRATAHELARMGAAIVVAELDRATAEGTATELRDQGHRALAWISQT
jgi:S-adenosylhomocysteine hydrolase